MFYNINPFIFAPCFSWYRFKVNKDWLSGIDSLLFFIPPAFPFFDALYIAFSDNLSTFAFY